MTDLPFNELIKEISAGKIVLISTKAGALIICSPDNLKKIREAIEG